MKTKLSVIIPVYNQESLLKRALDSIPLADDTQIVLLDDGSTDGTWGIALDWWRNHNTEQTGSIIHRWHDNKGIAATMNLGFSLANGEYIITLSSDDYFLTDFSGIRPYLDGKNDLIYYDLEINDGSIWKLTEATKNIFVGGVKVIRKDFLGDTKIPIKKWHEDVGFSKALQDKNPQEVYSGILLKHYNWPREGSLSWQANHGGDNA